MTARKDTNRIAFFRHFHLILALFCVGIFPASAVAFELVLGTGETGTFSFFAGRTVSRLITRHADDIACRPTPGVDDVHNLTNLQGGSLDLALVDSRMLKDATNKAGNFEFLDIDYGNLRIVLPLYDVPISLVVRSDAGITSLGDLKDKRVNAGPRRTATYLTMEAILAAKNWTADDFSLMGELPASHSQDTMAFCHGTIQAMIHIGVHPDPSLNQLFKLCGATMVNMDDSDIEKLVRDNSAYYAANIPGGNYPSHPQEVKTFGTRTMLVASSDLDEDTVYRIVAALAGNQHLLKRAHPVLAAITVAAARKNDTGISLHPGAAKFFREYK
jgi:TRAP transporter TAXI family solute receptor